MTTDLTDPASNTDATSTLSTMLFDTVDAIYEAAEKPERLDEVFVHLLQVIATGKAGTRADAMSAFNQELAEQIATAMMLDLHPKARPTQPDIINALPTLFLNRLSIPLLLIDERDNILFANSAALQLIDKRQVYSEASNTQALQGLKLQALEPLPVQSFKPMAFKGQQYRLAILPWQFDTEQLAERCRQRYALTQRETQVLELLLQSRNAKQISSTLNLSTYTISDHIKVLLAKTHTKKQQQLVQLAYRLYLPLDRNDANSTSSGNEVSSITLADGRRLSYLALGTESDEAIVYFHSFTGSRLELPLLQNHLPFPEKRWIAIDRPGFGDSSPLPGRTIVDFANDLETLRQTLGLKQLTLVGYCSGAAYALAYSSLYSERVAQCLLISPTPPADIIVGSDQSPILLKMYYRMMRHFPRLVSPLLGMLTRITPAQYIENMRTKRSRFYRLPPADLDLLSNTDFYQFYLANIERSMSGWRAEGRLMASDWGFKLDDLDVPISIHQGTHDTVSSFDMVKELQRQLGMVPLYTWPEETHFLIFRHAQTLFAQCGLINSG